MPQEPAPSKSFKQQKKDPSPQSREMWRFRETHAVRHLDLRILDLLWRVREKHAVRHLDLRLGMCVSPATLKRLSMDLL